jgi:myo-inositol 2-dehydrogenase / D-chiro-inositol 1-dehydrogenase
MTVRIGVVGTGVIGQDHVRRLTHVLRGAQVVAVSDVDGARAREVAASLPVPTRVLPTGLDLIADPGVDAVVVTSWGGSHEEYVLASIAAGKPVFCEKPLADTAAACRRIMDAEVAAGHRLVQVGFMRRYDAGYRAMKEVVDSGRIGAPLIMHCGHRNPSVPAFYTRENAINDTAVHEVDVARWLFGEEIVAVRVIVPRRSRHGGDLQDPLLLILETESGAIVDDEISVNIRYGYDIRGEIVGEDGTVALADSGPVLVRRDGAYSGRVPADWRERFARAYDVELQEWVDGVAARLDGSAAPQAGVATGPSSWDGFAAQVVCDAGLVALSAGGDRVPVSLPARPDLFAKP